MELKSALEVQQHLEKGNTVYCSAKMNQGDISLEKRKDLFENGQAPYAVIVTCSDSRVPPEHIFNTGLGELFVIRTAGNVIGDFELGSIEYGAEHLHAKLVVVLGHTCCGAVEAALAGAGEGNIQKILDEICSAIGDNKNARECELINVQNSIKRIQNSEIMAHLIEKEEVKVVGAIYDIETGKVTFYA